MRLDDEERAKDQERLFEARNMSAERKRQKTKLMEYGEVIEFEDPDDDPGELVFHPSNTINQYLPDSPSKPSP